MKISYNLTGLERKNLVGAICQELNTPMNYLGAPTFAYEIGEYHIDRSGTVTGPDNRDLIDALAEPHGFVSLIGEYDDTMDNAGPASPSFEDDSQPSGISDDAEDRIVIEAPLDGFTPEAIDNLCKLVLSKEVLIKKALGAKELPIQVLEDRIAFPWFKGKTDDGCVDAYARFITALCKMAKELRRVTAKEKPFENEKFAFRVFLLRLGFVGDEYKAARKILLRTSGRR